MITKCCGTASYVDTVDGGTYCTICDAEVDPATGRRLTERERFELLCKRELAS